MGVKSMVNPVRGIFAPDWSRRMVGICGAAVVGLGAVLSMPTSAAAETQQQVGSAMDNCCSTVAYVVSGGRYDYAYSDGSHYNLLSAWDSYYGYDYYRGFTWSSSAGRWLQSSTGGQYVEDYHAAYYSLIGYPTYNSAVLAASYYSWPNTVKVSGLIAGSLVRF